MNSKRPINLDLFAFQFPLSAKASILHRVSGIAMFVAIAFALYALAASLESEQSFNDLKALFDNGIAKFITWGILTSLAYHAVAGVVHILAEFGIADGKESGRKAAIFSMSTGVILAVLAGVWVW